MNRRNHTPEFKAKITLEIFKEEKSLNEIASEYDLNPNLLRRWKSEAIENMPQVFSDKNKEISGVKAGYEKQIEELYTEIGKLTTELTWL